ncbi:Osmosensitive K+ channel histidine kinase KdpD [Klebsiella pneumoniae]|nr:Osmosensitive K+ channel histidine kinase KdpD [Klebsiella pneumoniae]
MAAKRPFSLATRLTFFISLATIIAFFAFTWIMIHSVKAHFEERDVHDLRQLSTTLETVLDHADYPQARRLEIVKNIIAATPTSSSAWTMARAIFCSSRPTGRISAIC